VDACPVLHRQHTWSNKTRARAGGSCDWTFPISVHYPHILRGHTSCALDALHKSHKKVISLSLGCSQHAISQRETTPIAASFVFECGRGEAAFNATELLDDKVLCADSLPPRAPPKGGSTHSPKGVGCDFIANEQTKSSALFRVLVLDLDRIRLYEILQIARPDLVSTSSWKTPNASVQAFRFAEDMGVGNCEWALS
jgi:hypothetical protein